MCRFQYVTCLHVINLNYATHALCVCSEAADALRQLLNPIKGSRLLFEDDVEEVMSLYLRTSPLADSVLYSDESRRIVARWMPFLLRSARSMAEQLNSSRLHELVVAISRSRSATARDVMHDLCEELEEHVSNSVVWRGFLACAEKLMHTTTLSGNYPQHLQTFFKVLVADSLQMHSTLVMPAVEVARLVPDTIRYSDHWPSLSFPECGLDRETELIWSDVCMTVHEPRVATYYRPGDFLYRPVYSIENLRANGTVSHFHTEE